MHYIDSNPFFCMLPTAEPFLAIFNPFGFGKISFFCKYLGVMLPAVIYILNFMLQRNQKDVDCIRCIIDVVLLLMECRLGVDMLTTQQLSDLIEVAVVAPSMAALHALLGEFCQALGYERFAYSVRFPPSGCQGSSRNVGSPSGAMRIGTPMKLADASYLFLNNWPDEILVRYMQQGYISIDPGLRHCWNSPVPLHYDEPWFAQQTQRPHGEAAKLGALLLDWIVFDFLSGFSVGLQGQQGEAATLSISTSRFRDITTVTARLCAALAQGFLPYLHHRAMELSSWPNGNAVDQLTAREKECLRWASEGKTSWDIAQILKISERTVVAHLNNAGVKLGANNRVQAVARAVLFKFI
ncbi:MAG: LuxR family transcriptional regulator [Magnetococcus sp. YQC-3]